MSCFKQGPGAGKFPTLEDVPIVNPCEGFGHKAPFRQEVPFKLLFITQWYDERAEIEKRLLLSYYHYDGTIELKDLDRQKQFLHRRKLENIKLTDLFIGNKLYVLSRHIIILDYGDTITKEYCKPFTERVFLLARPEAMKNLPSVVQRLERCFRILYAKRVILTEGVARQMMEINDLNTLRNLQGQPVVGFFLMAQNALAKLKNLVGEDKDPQECLLKNHQSLRALYGLSADMNGFYYPEEPDCIIRDASFFFSGCPQCTLPAAAMMNGKSTCCVIKPHILREGRAGVVLGDIVASGYEITGFGLFWLNKRQAEEFFEIYQRIYVPSDYLEMVDELAIGPCMAVELTLKSDLESNRDCSKPICVVQCFRQCVGPADPDLARKVRPNTLRARHGLTKAQNAIHCTDLPEDAYSELEYFFRILDRRGHGVKSVTGDMSSC